MDRKLIASKLGIILLVGPSNAELLTSLQPQRLLFPPPSKVRHRWVLPRAGNSDESSCAIPDIVQSMNAKFEANVRAHGKRGSFAPFPLMIMTWNSYMSHEKGAEGHAGGEGKRTASDSFFLGFMGNSSPF